MNKVILLGRIGRDPEIRYTQGGAAVANFSVATTERWTDKSGRKEEHTEWHRIVAWGKLAEICAQYTTKGREVAIECKIQTREWDGKDGTKKQLTEILANEVKLIGAHTAPKERTEPTSIYKPGDFNGPAIDSVEVPDSLSDLPF